MLPERETPPLGKGSDPIPVLIALDWGSSSLRGWLLDRRGQTIEHRETSGGILTVRNGLFAEALSGFCADWLEHRPTLPVIACGMIGSRQGWREASYLRTPISPGSLAAHLTTLDDLTGRVFRIVPGLATRLPGGSPDVIRGEETQVFGALARAGADSREDRLFILPGTHSKWIDVHSGSVRAFRTCMTGELYALLRHQSILGRLCEEPPDADAPGPLAAFDDGVDRAGSDPGAIGHLLFTVRAEGLFGERAADCLPAYLSGLLIGAEIASTLAAFGHRDEFSIIGAPALCSRYRRALARLGVGSVIADGEPAREGLHAIATAAGLVDPA